MKLIMSFEPDGWPVGVELTRRNLNALLAKLDGNPPNSECTILAPGDSPFFVKAVENIEHYADRPTGIMHPATEAALHDSACDCLSCDLEGM